MTDFFVELACAFLEGILDSLFDGAGLCGSKRKKKKAAPTYKR